MQVRLFFGTPAKNVRIAALQSDNRPVLVGCACQQAIDFILGHAVIALFLADIEELGSGGAMRKMSALMRRS